MASLLFSILREGTRLSMKCESGSFVFFWFRTVHKVNNDRIIYQHGADTKYITCALYVIYCVMGVTTKGCSLRNHHLHLPCLHDLLSKYCAVACSNSDAAQTTTFLS